MNDSNTVGVKPRPTGSSRAGAKRYLDFFIRPPTLKLVSLKPFDLQTPYYLYGKKSTPLKICHQFNRLACFLGFILLSQSDLILEEHGKVDTLHVPIKETISDVLSK